MQKKKKTYLDLLEGAIRKLWRKHKNPAVIKALHTEIMVEPQPFIRGILNPQIAEFLVELYLEQAKTNPLCEGSVLVKDGVLSILDKDGRLIAETTSPKLIRNYRML